MRVRIAGRWCERAPYCERGPKETAFSAPQKASKCALMPVRKSSSNPRALEKTIPLAIRGSRQVTSDSRLARFALGVERGETILQVRRV